MMSISRKLFVTILALAIGFTLMAGICQNSYADEASGNAVLVVETGVEYATLGEAHEAIPKEGRTLKLLKDIDLGSGYFSVTKSLTLDLNGHTITSSCSHDDEHYRIGTVSFVDEWLRYNRIIDSSAEKTGSIVNTGNGYALFTNTFHKLTIDAGNYISNGNGIMCGDDVTINGGKVEAKGYAFDHYKADNIVTINDGVFKGESRTFRFVNWNDDSGGGFALNGGYYSDDRGNGSRVSRKAGTRLFKVGGKGEYKDWYELKTEAAKLISGASETIYPDIQEAVSSASDGDTVIVLNNCETDNLLINKAITLDLYGKTITEKGVMKLKSGAMTIRDSSASVEADRKGKIVFTKEDGSHTFDVIGSDARLILESGTLSAEKNTVLRVSEGAKVEMARGTISAGKCGIYVGANSGSVYEGTATVSGGTITGKEYGIYVHNGSAAVTGDTTFVGSDGKSVGMEADQTFTISGGKFSDGAGNGDGFTRAGGKYLCRFDQDNVTLYWLDVAQAFNENTGEYFVDLDEAKDFLDGDGNVVKVMKDIDLDGNAVYMWNKMVLDLNGHTITSSVDGYDDEDYPKGVLCVTNAGAVTITDSSEDKTGAIINNYSGQTKAGFAVWTDEGTKLTIEDGTFKSNNMGIHCGETIIMNGGKIDAAKSAIYLFPFDTAVEINDGVLKSGEDDRTFYFPYNRPGPEVTINGGYYSNDSGNNDDRINRKDDMLLLKVGGTGEYKDYYELKVPVAKLVSGDDEKIYADLQEAVNDAAEGDTIVMLNNCETDSLLINKGITLDLAGKVITEKGVMKATSGLLTIKDSSATDEAEGTGRIEFTKEDAESAVEVTGSSTGFHLEGGTLNSAKSTAVRVTERAFAVIKGGTISSSKCGLYVGGASGSGTAAIGGGTISGSEYGIYLFSGSVMVPGVSTSFVSSDGKSVGMEEGQYFYIEGGTYSDAEGNKEVYVRPMAEYLVKGKDVAHPERYAVGLAYAKRTVSGEDILYASLHDAVNDASESLENITLIMDITDHFEHSNKDSNIILDLNEKTLTVDENEGVSATNNAGMAIKNGTIRPESEDVKNVISANDTGFIRLDEGLTVDAAGHTVCVYDGGEMTIEGADITADITVDGDESAAGIMSGTINGDVKVGSETNMGGFMVDGGTINGEIYNDGDASMFLINGGKFKTDTGNNEEFKRPDNMSLEDPDGDGWYELVEVDKSELEKAISAAKEAEESIAVSEDGKDVDPTDKWTTAEEKKALDDAIAAAQEVADSKTATQKDVDDAAAAVKEATEAYNKAKKAGTKPAPAPTPTPTPTPTPEPTPDRKDQKGEDGTAFGKGASLEAAEAALASMTSDDDPAGTKFAPLYAQSKKVTKKSAKVTWKKVSGATKYVVYGNRCGKKYKFKKIKEVSGKSLNVKKVAGKKLAKKKNYKFLVIAVDGSNNVVSTSKVVHVITKGGKYKNYTKVKVTAPNTAKKGKLSIKAGKSAKIKAKATGKKVKAHRKLMYESLDTTIATVGAKNGKIKAVKKGTTRITVYASNGVYKQIKVTVK